jgi:phosphatidylglycerol---prolipoprotein diacylglyceryl transferase
MHPVVFAEIAFPGWDPVAFRISLRWLHLGTLQVRWYGLGYLAAFLIAGWVLDRLGKAGFVQLTKEAVSDLIGWLVAGVLLGGRLGYALFYEPSLLVHPLQLVRVWTGGLSFHGGLIGVVLASMLFARRRKLSWFRLADSLSLAVPFGIFLVRCANFVNAELFGRLAPAWLPWGVRFPTDPVVKTISPEMAMAGGLHWHETYARLVAAGAWAAVQARIPLRHPSQLYEALLEGAVTGLVVWTAYRRPWRAAQRPGGIAALFLCCYAAARFLVEFTRQPDAQLGFVLGPLSMGQLLSLGMLVFGLAVVVVVNRRSSAPSPQEGAAL